MTPSSHHLLSSQGALTPPPDYSPPSREAIRTTTNAILARTEFREDSVTTSLLKYLEQIEPDLSPFPGPTAWLLVAALVALLIWFARKWFPAMEPGIPAIRKPVSSRAPELDAHSERWREALDAAKQAISEKDNRRAVWILHRVFLGLLDKTGAIRFAVWKTNETYLRECPETHTWRPALLELTQAYDQLVYAHRPVDGRTILELFSKVEALKNEVTRGA